MPPGAPVPAMPAVDPLAEPEADPVVAPEPMLPLALFDRGWPVA